MIQRIVVPVDFSEASCRAARYTVEELAPQLRAEVIFVTVLEVSDIRVAMRAGLHGFETDEELHEQVEQWVEEKFGNIEASNDAVKARRDVRRGIPERGIVEAILEHGAHLVVMGAHGMGRRNPIGSKTEYVVAHADVPVMVVRAKPGPES